MFIFRFGNFHRGVAYLGVRRRPLCRVSVVAMVDMISSGGGEGFHDATSGA